MKAKLLAFLGALAEDQHHLLGRFMPGLSAEYGAHATFVPYCRCDLDQADFPGMRRPVNFGDVLVVIRVFAREHLRDRLEPRRAVHA